MEREALFQSILDDTRALLQQMPARRGTVTLLRETASLITPADGAAAPAPAPASPAAGAPAALSRDSVVAALSAMRLEVSACTRCSLCKTRTKTVFGVGNPGAELVFVGEAPGADEDRTGEPFVGKAGQLLTDIIVKGMRLTRDDVYICNVLKCRPPENRDPQPEEVSQCEPYLLQQLELIRPKVICALGRHAAQTLLRTTESTAKLRGKWHNYHGIPFRVTYHPAYLLRSPGEKRKAWEDIKEVMKVLSGEEVPAI